MRWLDNFADPETASQLYSGAFPLVDITVIPDDDIMQHRSMAALTLVQKHIRQRDMAQLLDKLTHLLMLEQMSGQQITVLVNYMAQAGDAEDTRTLLYGLAQRAAAWRITDDAGGNMACRRYGERHQGRRTARHKEGKHRLWCRLPKRCAVAVLMTGDYGNDRSV